MSEPTGRCGTRCGRPAKGGYICPGCAHRLRVELREIPAIRAQLDVALSRQSAMGRAEGGRSAETPMPYGVAASDAGRALDRALVDACRRLDPFLGPECWTVSQPHRLLLARIEELRHHSEASTMHSRIVEAVVNARTAIDRRPDRVYVGTCGNDEGREACTAELYVEAGEAYVICPACRRHWDVEDRRRILLAAVEDRLAHASLLAAAVTHLGQPIKADTIRKWANGKRKRLTRAGVNEDGRPLYRVGDVLDILGEDARRANLTPSSNDV